MTIDELAERTGEDRALVARLGDLALISPGDAFDGADVERVRLVRLLLRRGMDLDDIAKGHVEVPDLLDRYLEQLYPDQDYPTIALEEAARRAGVAPELAERLRDAGSLGRPGEPLAAADVEALHTLAVALETGFPEEALLQMIRVYADALGRVAEAEARLFHFYVHERLRASGMPTDQVLAMTDETSNQLLNLVEPTVLYFHRKGMERALREDLVLHLAEEAGLLPPDDVTGRLSAAVGFVDLARFTLLTEAMGDTSATEILDRFSDLVRRAVSRCDGRIVKQIGDAFMLVFTDPRAALEAALDIRSAANDEPQFLGTRQGLHWGSVLYREGDYYGASVNLAARIVAEAAADQLLVSAELRGAVGEVDGVLFRSVGRREMKHVAEPVELYAVHPVTEAGGGARLVDPVCGMVLASDEAAARLTWDGAERVFCSAACLQRFVAAPDRYA